VRSNRSTSSTPGPNRVVSHTEPSTVRALRCSTSRNAQASGVFSYVSLSFARPPQWATQAAAAPATIAVAKLVPDAALSTGRGTSPAKSATHTASAGAVMSTLGPRWLSAHGRPFVEQPATAMTSANRAGSITESSGSRTLTTFAR